MGGVVVKVPSQWGRCQVKPTGWFPCFNHPPSPTEALCSQDWHLWVLSILSVVSRTSPDLWLLCIVTPQRAQEANPGSRTNIQIALAVSDSALCPPPTRTLSAVKYPDCTKVQPLLQNTRKQFAVCVTSKRR